MARAILQAGDIGKQRAVVHYVMVVDDDAETARETIAILEKAGLEAKPFKDGGQVHSSLAMDRPDLVLLKLILPGESGFEICERIKKQDRFLPVVIYTEIELEAAQQLASKLGADAYILKPCPPETLLSTIREVADAVWERQADEHEGKEKGEIHFRCKCGHRMKEKLENRGRLMTCSQCQSMVQIPERAMHDMIVKLSDAANANTLDDPMRFLSVKCQHCGTYYKLFSSDLDKARTCPKCQKRQVGALSIIGAPLSRAALASSLRVLRILSGQLKGKKLMLPDQEITLGSSRTCQLKQYGEGVAPQHCTLKPTPLGILVNDLNTETGTFIDNERITKETLLEPGGLLKVGTLLFRLIGQNRDVNSTSFYDPKQAKAQQKAAEKGVKLFLSDKSTAEEAADVIQAHWDIVRKKSTISTNTATE
jgi:twitching motility two-component system response regulator PilH